MSAEEEFMKLYEQKKSIDDLKAALERNLIYLTAPLEKEEYLKHLVELDEFSADLSDRLRDLKESFTHTQEVE